MIREKQHATKPLRTIVQPVDLGDKADYVPKIDALIAQVRVVHRFNHGKDEITHQQT